MMKYILLFLCLTLAGCTAIGYRVITVNDDFEKSKTWAMFGNSISFSLDPMEASLDFDLSKTVKTTDSTTFSFVSISYKHKVWLFVREDNPATFLIDGEKIEIERSLGSVRRDVSSSTSYGADVHERFSFDPPKGLIQKLIDSKIAKVRLNGSNGSKEFEFDKPSRNRLADFVKKYGN